jgi:hypothetical protein
MAKTYLLRNIPDDIYTILIREQAELKEKCKCQKSLETTIYSLIRIAAEAKKAHTKKP